MLIKDVPQLAHHLRSLIELVSRYSYQLQADASLRPNPAGIDPLQQSSRFRDHLRSDLHKLFVPQEHAPAASSACQDHQQPARPGGTDRLGQDSLLQQQNSLLRVPDIARQHWQEVLSYLDLQRQDLPHALHSVGPDKLGFAGREMLSRNAADDMFDPTCLTGAQAIAVDTYEDGPDTWIMPLVQYGAAGLTHDEACTVRFLVLTLRFSPSVHVQRLWAPPT